MQPIFQWFIKYDRTEKIVSEYGKIKWDECFLHIYFQPCCKSKIILKLKKKKKKRERERETGMAKINK